MDDVKRVIGKEDSNVYRKTEKLTHNQWLAGNYKIRKITDAEACYAVYDNRLTTGPRGHDDVGRKHWLYLALTRGNKYGNCAKLHF